MKKKLSDSIGLIILLGYSGFLWSCSAELRTEREPSLQNEEVDGSAYEDTFGPSLIALSPFDGLSNVLPSLPLTLYFNEALDPATLLVTNDNTCSGSIQLSKDHFQTCVPLESPSLLQENQLVQIESLNGLDEVTTYQLRVTGTITDSSGNALQKPYEMQIGFTIADNSTASLPEQLTTELNNYLRQQAGLSNLRVHRSPNKSLSLNEAQIEALVEGAQTGIAEKGTAYSTSLEELLPAMLSGSMKRLGALPTLDSVQKQEVFSALMEGLASSILGKNEYFVDEDELMNSLVRTGITGLSDVGLAGNSLATSSSKAVEGLLGSLEEAGMNQQTITEIVPVLLGTAVEAVVETLSQEEGTTAQLPRSRLMDKVVLNTNSLSSLQQSLSLLAQTSMSVTSNWSWWGTSTSSWTSYTSTVVNSLISPLGSISSMTTTNSYSLVGSVVQGTVQGMSFLSTTSTTITSQVMSTVGQQAFASASSLSFSTTTINSSTLASTIQSSATIGLQTLSVGVSTSSLLTSVSSGVLTAVSTTTTSTTTITQVQSALGTDGTTPVQPDTTAPSLSALTSIGTTNDNTPSLGFLSTEAGAYAESCSGSEGALLSGENFITLTALADGSYSSCVLSVKDVVGNTNLISLDSFVIDTIPPTLASISLAGGASTTNTYSVNVSINASDENSGLAGLHLNETASTPNINSSWSTYSSSASFTLSSGSVGSRQVFGWVKDNAGNISAFATDGITINDTTGPVISSFSLDSGNAYTNSESVALTIAASDDALGISAYFSSEESTTPLVSASGWKTFSSPTHLFDNLSNGPKHVYLWLQDSRGNLSAVASDNITLDTQEPAVESFSVDARSFEGCTDYYVPDVSVLTGLFAGSWVSYTPSSSTTGTPGTTVEAGGTLTTLPGGLYAYEIGSYTYTHSVAAGSPTVNVAQSPIGCTPGISSYRAVNSQTIQLDIVASDTLSGVAQFFASEQSATPTASSTGWQSYSSNPSYTLDNASLGNKLVYVWVKDSAGNISDYLEDTVTLIDNTSPTITNFLLAEGADNTTSNTVSVSLAGTDDLSGVSHYYLSEDSTTPAADAAGWASYETSSEFVLSDGNGLKTVYLWIQDEAGNVSGPTSDQIELISSAPVTINGSLSGLVYEEDGVSPLEGVTVFINDPTTIYGVATTTDENGNWTAINIPIPNLTVTEGTANENDSDPIVVGAVYISFYQTGYVSHELFYEGTISVVSFAIDDGVTVVEEILINAPDISLARQ